MCQHVPTIRGCPVPDWNHTVKTLCFPHLPLHHLRSQCVFALKRTHCFKGRCILLSKDRIMSCMHTCIPAYFHTCTLAYITMSLHITSHHITIHYVTPHHICMTSDHIIIYIYIYRYIYIHSVYIYIDIYTPCLHWSHPTFRLVHFLSLPGFQAWLPEPFMRPSCVFHGGLSPML
jgi:hypothetical protein